MIRLSVNLNKIATLRNARGEGQPNLLAFAKASIDAGAHGITVHPRPDERHITRQDVFDLAEVIGQVEYNIEGYPDERYLAIIRAVKPTQATLVPDSPQVLTSNAGWHVSNQRSFLQETISQLKTVVSRVSLFVDPDLTQIEAAHTVGADRIELYTKAFADAYANGHGRHAIKPYIAAAQLASELGLGVNAGHDLTCANLALIRELPGLLEVSIGHALVGDALWYGWETTVKAYLKALSPNSTS